METTVQRSRVCVGGNPNLDSALEGIRARALGVQGTTRSSTQHILLPSDKSLRTALHLHINTLSLLKNRIQNGQ